MMGNSMLLFRTLITCSFFSSTWAQQYAGDVIPNSLPSVGGSEIAFFRIADPQKKNNNLTLTTYQSLQSNGQRVNPSTVQRAVIVVHGLQRDPDLYMSNMLNAISQVTSDPNVNQSSVVIVAPYFANGNDKGTGYPWTANMSAGAGSTSNALVWSGSQWASGGNNQYPYKSKTVSSYEVLDQLIKWFDDTGIFPNMHQIVIAGHSLGAQTVQRYAEVGNVFATTSPVLYWIGNPNSYGWLSASRPLSTAGCPTYDNWRDGFNNYTVYPMTYGAALVTSGRQNVLSQYNGRSKAYARGTQDFGDDSSTCAPSTTGVNRNERFFNFIEAFPASCPAPGTGQCDTIDYVDTGHDASAMFASDAGQARLFIDNFYGNNSKSYDFGYPRMQEGDDPYPNPSFNGSIQSGPNGTYAGNMTYAGCWSDNTRAGRSLPILAFENNNNTIELCASTCIQSGYRIAGLEYGAQCYCGNALSYGAQRTVESGCTQACPGNSSEICGNGNRLSVFSVGTPPQMPIPDSPEKIGNYTSYRCMTESTQLRALGATSYTDNTNMTLESCAAFCNGYQYFGTEYGNQCFCGGYFNNGSVVAAESDCGMVCVGNPSELCGGSARLTVYQLAQDAPVSVITQPPPASTTAAAAESATSSALPSSSACPATDGRNITDANGAIYTIHCSSDSSVNSYASEAASNSYLDCMIKCDAASSAGCIGWTYVGANNGTGPGTCYLKKASMGTFTAAENTLISAALVNGPSFSNATAPPVPADSRYCPAVDGTTVDGYLVHCSSDSSGSSYSAFTAASSYYDCMTACDNDSSHGCTGASYVGAANGEGGGTCYLKSEVGTVTAAGSNLLVISKNPTAATLSTSTSTTSMTQSSATSSMALTTPDVPTTTSFLPTSSTAMIIPATTTTSRRSSSATLQIPASTATNQVRTTTAPSNRMSSSQAQPSPSICPGLNNTVYLSLLRHRFEIECDIGHVGGSMLSISVLSFDACLDACDGTPGCVGVSLLGALCLLKRTIGASVYSPGMVGARLSASVVSSSIVSSAVSVIPKASPSPVFSSSILSLQPAIGSQISSTTPTSIHPTVPVSSFSSEAPDSPVETLSQIETATTVISSVFSNFNTRTVPPSLSTRSSASALPTQYTSLGCYTDSTKARTLGVQLSNQGGLTPGSCAVRCSAQGYKYSGTEAGKQCFCDNYIRNNASPASAKLCGSVCPGDSSQKCGGSGRLTILRDSNWKQSLFARQSSGPWTLMSCYSDGSSSRTLGTKYPVKGGLNKMTVTNCLSACQAAGRIYCGAENGNQCFGSNTRPRAAAAMTGDPLFRGCSTPCTGNSTEVCGGPNKILVYVNGKAKVKAAQRAKSASMAKAKLQLAQKAKSLSKSKARSKAKAKSKSKSKAKVIASRKTVKAA